jgi:hypothetical protein
LRDYERIDWPGKDGAGVINQEFCLSLFEEKYSNENEKKKKNGLQHPSIVC